MSKKHKADIFTKKCYIQFKDNIIAPYHYLAAQKGFGATQNWITRFPLSSIACLQTSAKCFPKDYLDKVRDDKTCNLSGDVLCGGFYDTSSGEHYDVIHCVRGGLNPAKEKKMKTDTFLYQAGDVLSAFYHVDDHFGRHWDPAAYAQMRENMKFNEVYDANAAWLSNLVSPIWESIRLT